MMLLTCKLLLVLAIVQYAECSERLLSVEKSIKSSSVHESVHGTWSADKAIDGNARRKPEKGYCAATNKEHNPWYELDLKKTYCIHAINVVGRGADDDRVSDSTAGYGHTLKEMEIKLGTNTSDLNVQTTFNQNEYLYNYTLPAPKLGRYVRLTLRMRNITQYFVICELYVYGDCAGKTYGKDCDDKCGMCLNGDACDSDSGNCSACSAGYQSPLCQDCKDGYYGKRCSNKCGKCQNGEKCNKKNGTCTACLTGYKPHMCQECDDGHFGNSCHQQCRCAVDTCDKTTGKCPKGGCISGYEGEKCDKQCESGTYGKNCVHQCGSCADHQPCNRTTGLCENGCFPGSIGPHCNMTCEDGFYGDRCNNTCEDKCGEIVVCRKTDGLCPESLESDVFTIPRIVGGSLIVIVLGSLIIGIIIIVKRRQAQAVPRSAPSFAINTIRTFSVKDERQSFMVKAKQTEAVAANNDSAQSEDTSLSAAQPKDEICEEIENHTNDDNDHVYYGFVVKESDLKVNQLWDFIHERRMQNDIMFHREFAACAIPPKLLYVRKTDQRADTKGYMRRYGLVLKEGMFNGNGNVVHNYEDTVDQCRIPSDDHTRVPLKTEQGESDYINACYINGHGQMKRFIASQGPTKAMIDDFWRMIWQQKSQQIVMLTNLVEMKIEKCLIYWPTDGEVKYSGITVSKLSEVDFGDYVVRKLNVRQTKYPRLVTQYHFKKWPDKNVPDNTWSLVNFWRTVAKDRDTMKDSGPIVVHCSAGIGRTGTFIALDHAYHQAKLEGSLCLPSIIRTLREQRVNMVQTRLQYIYLHEAVADALLFGTHSLWAKQFDEVYCFLKQLEPGTDVPRLRTQYDLIISSIEAKENKMKDLKGTEGKQQTDMTHIGKPSLCATLLPNTMEKDAYIVARTPDKMDIPDLWSLIYKQRTKTIITLIDAKSQDEKIECFHSEEKTHHISLVETGENGLLSERTLSYQPSGSESNCVTLKQFVYSNCLEDENEPFEAKAMIELIENVLLWEQEISEHNPILVHCSTGSKLSGLVCVLINEINRIKTEKERLHIVQSVKLMKSRNKDIIPSYEQYRYIHEVIRCFLDGGPLYANI